MLDLLILGGGISGLTLAHAAQKAGLQFQLLEASSRVGGVIRTLEGTQESGPDVLLLKPAVVELLHELNLDDQLIRPAPSSPRIARHGKLWPLPDGFRMLAPTRLLPFALSPLLSWPGKFRALADLWLPAGNDPDPSLGSWVTRRLGKELCDQLVQPLLGGIYAADPARLSVAATMPHLLALEKRGGLIRGLMQSPPAPPSMASLRDGLSVLAQRLQAAVAERVELSAPVASLEPLEQGWMAVDPRGGRRWTARQLALALPAPAAGRLLQGLDPELALPVQGIHCRSVAVLNLSYQAQQLGQDSALSGALIPIKEGGCISAFSVSHLKWPERARPGQVHLRIHLGGFGREQFLDLDDEALIALALRQIAGWIGLKGQPGWVNLQRHQRQMPEYRCGHLQTMARLDDVLKRWPGLWMAGNWLRGVGMADCITRARELALLIRQQALPQAVGV